MNARRPAGSRSPNERAHRNSRYCRRDAEVYPFEVLLPRGVAGNPEDSIVLPHQIRTISTLRIHESIGLLADPGLQAEIETRLLEHLGIDFEPEGLASTHR